MAPLRIGLLGITGGVGGHFARIALEAGHEVVALARTPDKVTLRHSELKVIKGDATNAADVGKVVQGMDAIISCVGNPPRAPTPTMHLIASNILSNNPTKVVFISSLGIGGSSPTIRCILSLIAGTKTLPMWKLQTGSCVKQNVRGLWFVQQAFPTNLVLANI